MLLFVSKFLSMEIFKKNRMEILKQVSYMDKTELLKMSWKEAEEAFKKIEVVIVPVGATHGHGPTPVGCDTLIPEKLAKMTAEKTNVIVCPTLPYGWTVFNKDYPGAFNIDPETLFKVYMAICKSLCDNGIKKALFINGHGGNTEILRRTAYAAREEFGMLIVIFNWWEAIQDIASDLLSGDTRDQELAISVAVVGKEEINLEGARHPHWTRNIFGGNIVREPHAFTFKKVKIDIAGVRSRDLDELGEPIKLSTSGLEEAGSECLKRLADWLVDFVKEFAKVKIPKDW